MIIGVVSDTHNFFDPKLRHLLPGVQHILHAGDIGQPHIIVELEQFAPVTAVSGNTDDGAWHYHHTRIVELAGRKFLVHHIVEPHSPGDQLQELITRERPEVIVFGHTHRPFCETIGGILYFNPGYAGKSRFNMPRSIALLHCTANGIRAEYKWL
jgi:putative phosphoesterase